MVRVHRPRWLSAALTTTALLGGVLLLGLLPASGGLVPLHAAQARSLASPITLPSSVLVSAPPTGSSGPDDLTYLVVDIHGHDHGLLFTGYQNGINTNGAPGSVGGPYQSTVAGYDPSSGALVWSIKVTGKVDGLTADPSNGVLIATVNEDTNSSLYVIDPSSSTATNFQYSPNPSVSGNGGSDSIAIWHGEIYLSHSNPSDTTQATQYRASLDWSTGVAKLTPLFYDNSTATNAVNGSAVQLALTDPDTNYVMPNAGERFAGSLATISQADGMLIFASQSWHHGVKLSELPLSDNVTGNLPPADGLTVSTARSGTLYVVDAKAQTISALKVSNLPVGTVFIGEASDNGNPLIGTLNLSSGQITPFGNSFENPKGMFFLPAFGAGDGQGQQGHDDDNQGNQDDGGNGDWSSGSWWDFPQTTNSDRSW